MTIRSDPEKNEPRALFDAVDLKGKNVLEIGCGDGRMTFRYADAATQVTAIDPFKSAIEKADKNLPETLRERVSFLHTPFEDFARTCEQASFDVAILPWSL